LWAAYTIDGWNRVLLMGHLALTPGLVSTVHTTSAL
jgi:hypothetical protein